MSLMVTYETIAWYSITKFVICNVLFSFVFKVRRVWIRIPFGAWN